MSLNRPVMDERGAIDLRSIDALSRDDLRGWIRDRLHGRDLSCSGADRTDDMPEYLLQILYPKLDCATREDFQGIVLGFLADLSRNPDSEWLGKPGSRLLLMLDPVLVQSPRRIEAVGLLLGMADTPRFTEGAFPNLHFRALQALLGLRHRADRRFWERQFRVGGERYSPVVLEGLALIDASALLDWLADVRWSEAVSDAFEGLLPSLLEDYGAAKIAPLIEHVLPRLTPEAAAAVQRMCEEEGLTIGPNRSPITAGGGMARPGQARTGPSPAIRQAAILLRQVSDPTRLQVLLLLAEQERNVSTLCADLGHQSQPAVSHHLALLRHGRLIEPRRQGKNNVYSLTDEGRKLAEAVRDMAGDPLPGELMAGRHDPGRACRPATPPPKSKMGG